MKKKVLARLLTILLAVVMVLSLAACGNTGSDTQSGTTGGNSGSTSSGGSSSSGGSGTSGNSSSAGATLKVGIYGGLDSLNPWSNGRITKDMVTYVLYETLASCQNGATEIDPILMKSFSQVDDVTYDVEIYDYIKDAAGNPVTASDIKFSFDQYCSNWANSMDSIEVTGEYTVQIKLTTTAAGAFEYLVCKVPIATEKAFNDSADGLASDACGTMPYTVASEDYVGGTSITMRKTGEYWQTDESLIYEGSKSYADVIEFQILSEPTQLALAVRDNNIQIAMYAATSMLDEIKDYDGIELIQMPSSEDRGVMFCMTEDSIFYDNLALRQAVLYAIDNEAVAEACGYGYGAASDVMCGSEELTVGFNSAWKTSPYKYDVEKAKALLEEANYDGTTLRLLCNTNATISMMWQIIKENLNAAGINAELNVIEGTAYGAARDGTSGEYDMAYAGPGNGGYVTSDLWKTLFDKNNNASGRTWAGLDDPELQALYNAIAAPGGYTQENLDAFYNYIVDNALYYEIYSLPEYAAYNTNAISGYFLDWNRFIRANTIQLS